MKLSKAQEKAIQEMKSQIDKARKYGDFKTWLFETNSFIGGKANREEIYQKDRERWDRYIEYYEKNKKGLVLSTAGKNTLESLENKGLITIVELDNYRKNGVIDWVQLLNY